MSAIITLTTDFTLKGPYVGAMKGSILSVNSEARIEDISHEIGCGSIREGSIVISNSYSHFPKGTVHVGVIDPGVGTSRRPIIVETECYTFVGPDNGLFTYPLYKEKIRRIIHITSTSYTRPTPSNTFHGRDIFGPVAAYLSLNKPPSVFGNEVEDLERLHMPAASSSEGKVTGEVIYCDPFGNLITSIREEELKDLECPLTSLTVSYKGREIPGISTTYGAAAGGELVALISSSENLEIALNLGSASTELGGKEGDKVVVSSQSNK